MFITNYIRECVEGENHAPQTKFLIAIILIIAIAAIYFYILKYKDN